MPIGEVTDMLLRYRVQIDDPTLARLPVFIELDEKRLVQLGTTRAAGLRREGLEDLIRLGLRARLETQSLVTGVLYVGLDFLPDTPVVRVLPPRGCGPRDSDHPDDLQAVGGDFFAEVPRGADTYVLKHVIHDRDDERAVAILANVRRAMDPNGRLLIVEGVYPSRIDRSVVSRGAAANDVNMLVNTGGRQRSEAEFRELFAAAGFRLARIVPTPAPLCVIEGERV